MAISNSNARASRSQGRGCLPAVDIEAALVWAYQAERVDDRVWAGGAASPAWASLAALGCRVDTSGFNGVLFGGGAAVDGDAEAIAEAVARLGKRDAGANLLVRNAATTGQAPQWRREMFVSYLTPDERRHRGADQKFPMAATMDGRHPGDGKWCPVLIHGSPEVQAKARADYGRWHAGLVWLVTDLAGRLAKRVVIGPAAAAAPWDAPARGLPGRGDSLLCAESRAALLRDHERGLKPARLAEAYGLKVNQVYEMLKRERGRNTRA